MWNSGNSRAQERRKGNSQDDKWAGKLRKQSVQAVADYGEPMRKASEEKENQ